MVATGDRESGFSRLAALLMVMLVCGAVVVPGTVLAETDETTLLEDGLGAADDLYLDEDGNAVLVYSDDADEEFDELHMGGHVAEGLLYLFGTDSHDMDEVDQFEGVEMNASALLSGDVFEADGSLAVQQPDELEALDARFTGEVSEDTNEMSANAHVAYLHEPGLGAADGAVQTSGDVTIGHDTFALEADGTFERGTEPRADTERYELSVEDSSEGYSAEVTQHEYVIPFQAEQWESRETARETLEQRFQPIADELDGEVALDITHYAFEDREQRSWLELEYTVDFEGVDDGLASLIAEDLREDPDIALDAEQAAAIGEAVTEIELGQFDIRYVDDGATLDFAADVRVDGFDELVYASIEAADDDIEELEEFAEFYDAQAATDMQSHVTWDVAIESDGGSSGDSVGAASIEPATITVDAELAYDVEHWDAYVAELEDRGIETTAYNVAFDFVVEDVDGEIHADGEFVIEQEDLVGAAMDGLTQMLNESDDQSATEFVEILETTDLEVAKVDVGLDDRALTIEAGAQIDDLGEFFRNTEAVPDEFVVDAPDGDLYVHVHDVVDDPDALDAVELESYAFVDEDTQVHEPGEWDEEFPRFDAETAADYLDVELSGEDETTGGGSIPGFGPGLALIGLLAGSLFARRYER